MNQILQTEEPNWGKNKKDKNNNYNFNNKNMDKKPIDIKKIIIFFGIVIIVFGLALIGWFILKSSKNQGENQNVIVVNPTDSKPKLTLEETDLTDVSTGEENQIKELKITAYAEVGIDQIIYSWNDEEIIEKNANGLKTEEIHLNIPTGENELYIKVTDVNGEETEQRKTYTVKNEEKKPKIDTTILTDEGKVKIVATSEIPMKYIKYSWENDDEVIVKPTNEEDISIETIIDVKRGNNSLKIVASDINNNRDVIELPFKGINKPEITVGRTGSKVYMKITHDQGFKSIVFNINGKEYTYNKDTPSYDPETTKIEYYFDLIEGENQVSITATSLEDENAVATYIGRCSYTEETEE